ncbi:MAG: hypothetical protein ACI35R_06310 [Bacillus sp. (in: firmicutes)]
MKNRKVFSKVYAPVIVKAMSLKKSFGFYEKDLYIIKEHRVKQSIKVKETLLLVDGVMEQIKCNESYMSKEVLALYYDILRGLNERKELSLSNRNQLLSRLDYKINRQKLLLLSRFLYDMKKLAGKADMLYSELADMFQFFSAFCEHLMDRELVETAQTAVHD